MMAVKATWAGKDIILRFTDDETRNSANNYINRNGVDLKNGSIFYRDFIYIISYLNNLSCGLACYNL